MERVDVIVIGSGQGGVPFAVDRAKSGDRVVLFDRGKLGGSCVNYGCTPSKAFLACAHTAGRARLGKELGVRGDISIDFGATMDRVRSDRASTTDARRRKRFSLVPTQRAARVLEKSSASAATSASTSARRWIACA